MSDPELRVGRGFNFLDPTQPDQQVKLESYQTRPDPELT